MAARNALCFFFFQAEDGIRDLTVTGVQTCALPISAVLGAAAGRVRGAGARARIDRSLRTRRLYHQPARPRNRRSGERRVGEEGRSRGSPYHLKKKKTKKVRMSAL